MEKPSLLEKVSGNVGTTVAATLIAASGGAYLAPILPVLTGSLANGRYQRRIDSALSDLNNRLSFFEDKISSLSDTQFQLISETVISLMKTTSEEKIELLKSAVVYTVNDSMLS
ncbi:hypothetical protein NW622_004734, partial [Vibrio alginolyticus]|nr:hypothetical protein [Vibrio alginolyticus]